MTTASRMTTASLAPRPSPGSRAGFLTGVLGRAGLAAEAAIVVCWAALLAAPGVRAWGGAAAMAGMRDMGSDAGDRMPGMARSGSSAVSTIVGAAPMWAAMAAATMLPAALPAARHIGVNSLRRRRHRAVAEFVATYVVVWVVFGALATMVLVEILGTVNDRAVLAGALALAALFQASPQKRLALGQCHRGSRLPAVGWRAEAGSARFGLRSGTACVASCWALMLAMVVATGVALLWDGALAGVVLMERTAERPWRVSRLVAVALAGAALLTAVSG